MFKIPDGWPGKGEMPEKGLVKLLESPNYRLGSNPRDQDIRRRGFSGKVGI